MKKLILLVTIVLGMLFTSFVFAACEQPCPPPEPCMKAHPMPCDKGEETGMMMFCAMLKGHEDIKAVLKDLLVLQQRSLHASVKEKRKIKAEIDKLIQKLDAMPDMMDCPMMYLGREGCMDCDVGETLHSPAQHRSR